MIYELVYQVLLELPEEVVALRSDCRPPARPQQVRNVYTSFYLSLPTVLQIPIQAILHSVVRITILY